MLKGSKRLVTKVSISQGSWTVVLCFLPCPMYEKRPNKYMSLALAVPGRQCVFCEAGKCSLCEGWDCQTPQSESSHS